MKATTPPRSLRELFDELFELSQVADDQVVKRRHTKEELGLRILNVRAAVARVQKRELVPSS